MEQLCDVILKSILLNIAQKNSWENFNLFFISIFNPAQMRIWLLVLLGTSFGQEDKILSRKKRIDEVNEDYDEKDREIEKVLKFSII